MNVGIISNILSFNEVLQVIRNAFGNLVELDSYEIDNESGLTGFLGEYYSLTCVVRMSGAEIKTCKYFIKSVPVIQTHKKKIVEKLKVFPKEETLYKDLFANLQEFSTIKWNASCYYARSDVLVLEDLRTSGYTLLDKCPSMMHIKAALKTIASLHGSSLLYEELKEANIYKTYGHILHEIIVRENNGYWTAGIKAACVVGLKHPKFQSGADQHFLKEEFLHRLEICFQLVLNTTKFKNVCCHRDTWGKNLLFRNNATEGLECVLVDFQNCRYSPPAVDVLFYIFLNMEDRNERDQNLHELLEFYYKQLEKNCEMFGVNCRDLISWEEFSESCNTYKPLILAINAIYVPVVNVPFAKFSEIQKAQPDVYYDLMENDRTEFVLSFMEINVSYKKKVFDVVEDLINCLKPI